MLRKFVSPEEALRAIQKNFKTIVVGSEEISTANTYGRVLAEEIASSVNVPPFDRSNVDGYSVKSSDTFKADESKPVKLKVLSHVSAGEVSRLKVKVGFTVEIATGAPLPKGSDAVVMLENAHRKGHEVNIYRSVAPGENVLKRGGDIKIGEVVLRKSQQIGARELGVLAAIGLTKLKVFKQPRVAVLSTGNELVEPGKPLSQAKIYDINRSTITASVLECGCKPIILGIVKDELGSIKSSLKKGLETSDVIITSGSTSSGIEDLIPSILNDLGEPGIIVGGLSTKPGKPTTVAVVNGKIVFALPGHPTSALTIFNLLVRPLLRQMAGLSPEAREFLVEAQAAVRIFSAKGRRTYATVKLERTSSGNFLAYPISSESGAITTLAKADGFIEIPETREFIEKGEQVNVHLLTLKLS
ncbi:MAG TPA: gephyrin-like molybdotransferase Glp [archaeon]|nr:gephyrin-like molybdotransferase Glp [archaeon]